MEQGGAYDAVGRVEGGAGAIGVDVAEQPHHRQPEVAAGVAEHPAQVSRSRPLAWARMPTIRPWSLAFLATTPVIRLE